MEFVFCRTIVPFGFKFEDPRKGSGIPCGRVIDELQCLWSRRSWCRPWRVYAGRFVLVRENGSHDGGRMDDADDPRTRSKLESMYHPAVQIYTIQPEVSGIIA